MSLTITWAPPVGDAVTLHGDPRGAGIRVLKGATGLDSPPINVETATAIGLPGNVRLGRSIGARKIVLPVRLSAASRADYRTRFTSLIAMLMQPGTGALRIISPEADRYLECSFLGGTEGDMDRQVEGDTWWRGELEFMAHDPYWRDSAVREIRFSSGTQAAFFPFFPMRLNPNATFGTYVAPVMGDAPSWPEWEMQGPFTGFALSSRRPGALEDKYQSSMPSTADWSTRFSFDPRAAEPTLTYLPSGYVYPMSGFWSSTVWPSTLWSLVAAGQQVSVSVSGSTAQTTAIMRWRPRWLTWRAGS